MQTTTIFFYVSIAVLVVAMVACFILSRNQASSIQTVAKAAIRFGHGELDVRVPIGGKNTVEVDDLATSFNAMAESLAKAEVQRREFVANLSFSSPGDVPNPGIKAGSVRSTCIGSGVLYH